MHPNERLKTIEDRCTEQGCDGDTLWLVMEVKRLQHQLLECAGVFLLDKTSNSAEGICRP